MAVNITDISKLQQLANAYKVYNSTNRDNINNAESYLFQIMEEIMRTKNILEHRLEEANENVNQCIIALASCESRLEYDEEGNRITPNCRNEAHNLDTARREKLAAQNCVDAMNRYLRIINEYKNRYDGAKAKFQNLLDHTNQQAIMKLERYDSIAREYISINFEE